MKLLPSLLIVSALACFGCASAPVEARQSSAPSQAQSYSPAYRQSGLASYYADKFQGKSTASGEPYDKNALTGAHRKLPFGTRVRVTNTKNGKSVVVRINDRGPYSKKRVIDLSRAAFSTIGNTSAGLLSVTVEVVD